MSIRCSGVALGLILPLMTDCGGGSNIPTAKEGDTIHLSVSPLPVTQTAWEREVGVQAWLTVTARPVPATSVWVALEDPDGALIPGPLTIQDLGSGTYGANLPLNTSRPPGAYSGNFTLHLCKDPNCSTEWTVDGATIAYQFTITDSLSAEILVDDVMVDGSPGFDSSGMRLYDVLYFPSGHTIEIRASEPVTWSYSIDEYGAVSELSRTATTYRATVTSTSSVYAASAYIRGTTAAGKRMQVWVVTNTD